jgi:D-methionine transport system substrate-binding protein
MNIIMLGAPGAGKGTQAAVLCEHFGIPTISTGNMIREALKNGTEMGLKAKSFMDEGKLVPDEVVIGIVKERLSADDCKKGFILDGFPRTIPQAEALDNMGVEIQHVINIDISDEKIINRMSGRRVCENCGRPFHIVTLKPKKEGVCDDCGGTLHCQNGRILIKRGGCRCHRGSALHGSIRFSDCDQGHAGGGENVSDCRSNDFPWHDFGIFRDGRNRRRRRTGRYCHPLWLHQMADRYHGCHSGASGNFIPDFPDDRNEDCESAGSQKVAITNLHIFLRFKEDTIMKKKVLSTILAGVLALSTFAGCGSSAEESTDTSAATKEETTVAATEETVSAESTESTDTAAEGGTIKVAASATPHAEILEEAKKILADEGWDLEIKIFDDYVMPNEVVESGEFDANYFQHIPYLESFNNEKGTHLVNAGGIHYEPFGIYPGTKSDLSELADGDTIAVPNDTTNEARALLLLQDNGIITLKEGAGLEATVNDIAENPHNVKIEELAAEQVARVAPEVAFVVLNGNYALQAGFSVAKDALAYEASDSEAAKTYVNIIAVKEGHENDPGIQALVKVLKSDEIKQYINDTYDGAVIPFED